tara:strand:+ start:636 stop:1052 length:417 start_codon:yes stop_codon:yes gene_type:complete
VKTISISLPDKDYRLLVEIAKEEKRRLSDLAYLLFGKGLDVFFCETHVSVKKTEDDYTEADRLQQKINEDLEKSEGWQDLDYDKKREKGWKHVCEWMSNHERRKNPDGSYEYIDPLIEPLAERIESYALNPIVEEVAK